jgi:hypothetical protein
MISYNFVVFQDAFEVVLELKDRERRMIRETLASLARFPFDAQEGQYTIDGVTFYTVRISRLTLVYTLDDPVGEVRLMDIVLAKRR